MSDLVEVCIEVKSSRRGRYSIGDRDLKGLQTAGKNSEGLVAFLINSSYYDGPQWVLVPAKQLKKQTYSEKKIFPLRTDYPFWDEINHLWGDILLDTEFLEIISGMNKIDQKSIHWLHQRPLPKNKTCKDTIRQIRVAESLEKLREILSLKWGKHVYKKEGFIHQQILNFAFVKLGYDIISNNVGVPDFKICL